jgi:AraC-like DNA-binding protein
LVSLLSILDLILNTEDWQFLSGESFSNIYNEKDTSRINNVYHFLMQHFSRDILLDEVAAVANMAPTAFCRYFKEHTGKTFSLFLNELRIKHACNLLLHPDKSISEICYECGYNNLTNFNKFFKKIVQKTPSAYRLSLNE